MEQACQLAGFFAAHAIWSVSDGEMLIPMLALEDAEGQRSMLRLIDDDTASAVAAGQERQATNPEGHACSALLHDAYLTLGDSEEGKLDAIVIHVVDHDSGARLVIGVPYRHADEGFAVHRPKFLEAEGIDEDALEPLGQAFFAGVDAHEQGSAVWNEHLDESR
jgi:hypothetical protein